MLKAGKTQAKRNERKPNETKRTKTNNKKAQTDKQTTEKSKQKKRKQANTKTNHNNPTPPEKKVPDRLYTRVFMTFFKRVKQTENMTNSESIQSFFIFPTVTIPKTVQDKWDLSFTCVITRDCGAKRPSEFTVVR